MAIYEQEAETLATAFEFELCDSCGGDLKDHIIAPDALGRVHAWCKKEPVE
jgi:hypothetical protein